MSPKKFSTRRLTSLATGAGLAAVGAGLAAALAIALSGPVAAQQATPPLELAPGAPDKHVVRRGDTLWDISATFLKAPWRWPEIWQLNREQIANPHLIYPGDIVYLDHSGASPRLRLARPFGTSAGNSPEDGVTRLEPLVRVEPLDAGPISTISTEAIALFVNRPLIVDEKGLADSPRIVAAEEGRFYLGQGDRAYVRGIREDSVTEWQVYRPAKPLLDPDTRQALGYEALYLGSARVVRTGDPATVRILKASEEIGEGDRLVPAEPARPVNSSPRPPEKEVSGKIVSVHRGITQVGKHSVVALNVGSSHGLEIGHVLTVQQTGKLVKDRGVNQLVKLPNEPIGQLLVFRTFDTISYGLIVEASQSISVGDTVVNP